MSLSHVYMMMGTLRPGDRIFFNSYAACSTTAELCRKGSVAIPATGAVLKIYPRFVVVVLKKARECVMWDSIVRVNGVPWPLCNERTAL